MFVFNDSTERMFDRHMFAKHSFDVKHLLEILTTTAYTPVSVTPQEHSGAMTAILTHPADPRPVRPRVAAHPGVARPATQGPSAVHDPRTAAPRTDRPSAYGASAHGLRVVQPAEVYRRRRLLVLAVVLSMVVGLWSYGNSSRSSSATGTRSLDAVVVVVQPGDTLWSIATWLDPGADPRRLVDELSDLTGSTTLQPGQRLVIPANLLE